jgi:hypothetical protein
VKDFGSQIKIGAKLLIVRWITMKIKIKLKPLQEVIKKVDGKYVVYPKKGGKRLGTHDTLEGAKKQLAAIEISKAQNEAQLEEISAMGGGAVAGYAAPVKKKDLDEESLEEMYSDSGKRGMIGLNYGGGDEEHEGHVERSKYLGLKNVMESDEDQVKWKLTDFADNPRNASRAMDVLEDIKKNIGVDKLKSAVLGDPSAKSRIGVMNRKFNYDPELLEKIKNDEAGALEKYYQFLINEFLFWISHNPMASAATYGQRRSLLSKPTKDLAYGLVSRYVSNPEKRNPRALSNRISKQAEFYKLEKDLYPTLYNLPE